MVKRLTKKAQKENRSKRDKERRSSRGPEAIRRDKDLWNAANRLRASHLSQNREPDTPKMSKQEIAAQKKANIAKRNKDRRDSRGPEAIRRDLDLHNAAYRLRGQINRMDQIDSMTTQQLHDEMESIRNSYLPPRSILQVGSSSSSSSAIQMLLSSRIEDAEKNNENLNQYSDENELHNEYEQEDLMNIGNDDANHNEESDVNNLNNRSIKRPRRFFRHQSLGEAQNCLTQSSSQQRKKFKASNTHRSDKSQNNESNNIIEKKARALAAVQILLLKTDPDRIANEQIARNNTMKLLILRQENAVVKRARLMAAVRNHILNINMNHPPIVDSVERRRFVRKDESMILKQENVEIGLTNDSNNLLIIS